jgi:hypothetical protein
MRSYFGEIGADVPLLLVNGNHDGELGWLLAEGKNSQLPIWAMQARQAYYPNPIPNYFYSGSQVQDSASGSIRDGYYSFDWGNSRFIVLDPYWYTTQRTIPNDPNSGWFWTLGRDQYEWLRAMLADDSVKYKFVFIHNLVGGSNKDGRGGIEAAPYFEWGGENADGTYGFDQYRPGWEMPIHELLVKNHVTAVFHGHDHVFVKQDLDGIVYQEVPQPNVAGCKTNMALDYGYTNGEVLCSSGHLLVTVKSEQVTVTYVRTYSPDDKISDAQKAKNAFEYTIQAGK